MRRRRIAFSVLVLGLAASIGLAAPAAPNAAERTRDPVPLRGAELRGETGLRLLVADNPPFVLEVDTGRVLPTELPAISRGTVTVTGVAGRAAVVVARSAWERADIYAVRGSGARVSSLGTGTNAWPAADGSAVWVESAVSRSRCALRKMGLDGQVIRAARAFPCATLSDPSGGSLGLVGRRTRVLDPHTGRLVLKTRWGVLGAAGTTLLLAGPGEQLTLLDGETGSQRRLRSPSTGWRGRPAIDPQARFVALVFGVPSWSTSTLPKGWKGGPLQVLDVWLLDTKTASLTRLPGMPAFVALKRTSLAWTDDGRLVLLGESNGKDVVAVWRPGQGSLALKTVQLPERIGGGNSFAPLD